MNHSRTSDMDLTDKMRKMGLMTGRELEQQQRKEQIKAEIPEERQEPEKNRANKVLRQTDLSESQRDDMLSEHVGGHLCTSDTGSFWLLEKTFGPDYQHGSCRVSGCPDLLHLLSLNPEYEGFSLDSMLLLDIETSGLSGGAGTFAFMICIGHISEDGSVNIQQLLMRDMDDEPAMLEYLNEQIRSCRGLITFNGRSFDVPVLETRFRMNGLPCPVSDMPNLDLLFLARCIAAGSMTSHRLGVCEEVFLNFHRYDDVPGAQVPAMYQNWLNNGNVYGLKKVFDHNLYDVLSLAVLAGRFGYMTVNPETLDSPDNMFGIARLMAKSGRRQDAVRVLRHSCATCNNRRSMLELATLLKQEGDYPGSAEIWSKLITSGPDGLLPMEETAKYLEHHKKDLNGALEITLEALSNIRNMSPEIRRIWFDKFLRRKHRLIRRTIDTIEKTATRSSSTCKGAGS